MKAYRKTQTNAARSQEGIRKVLAKYGADGVQFSEDWKERILLIRFLYSASKRQHSILFRVPIPEIPESVRNRKRTTEQIARFRDQALRSVWRALFYAIKSRMESVDFGIESFEEAFLSHFEIPGTTSQIGDVLIPRLQSGKLALLEK